MSDEPRHAVARLRRDLRTTGHDWFEAHRDELPSALRDALAEPEAAVALFADVWPVVPVDVDEAWSRELLDVGAELAAALPTSLLLAKGFRRAAQSLREQGALRLAAVAGMRELAVHRLRDDDPDAAAGALHDLAATYRAQGRMHKVVGCADEVLELYLLHGDRPGTARALTHLGSLMAEVGRHDSAIKYLSRADKLFADLDDPAGRARCLPELGRALWLTGDRAEAHRRFNRALALLIGTDDAAAQRVRDLVADLRSRSVPEPVQQGHADLDQQADHDADPAQDR
ncbi:tetratricopeptide repeat protein [Saccharothrix saharensis]|uniref:Tetratricopeptide repeat protein n=1 Tax=Saccharothrix saharensis TaxID=571190 RepID=A0A543JEP3_9PSEU|nr:tetratricopeptide repeat protein [Saccharothrix saharensis]TQM81313.1 tetratricopeptide repeat protein [Saccharothrix saharensis]